MHFTGKDLLIRSASLMDPRSGFTGQVRDVLIEKGIITKIGSGLVAENVQEVNAEGCVLSPGWFDLNSTFGEPGHETREDLTSGASAALKGGFTGVALMPDTQPALHSKSEIEFMISRAASQPVEIIPVGAISYNREGKEMAEMYDMWLSGARAFSDGDRPVQHAGLLLRALQYASDFGALIMSNPEDASLAGGAKVHEGISSLLLGMKGIPAIAEEMMVTRDLMLAEYTSCRIHFMAVSTAGSVELIRQARKKGIRVTAAVAAHHLVLDDTCLVDFDTNYKVKPPLRGSSDQQALLEGLLDGTLDTVCSQHTPQDIETKHVEFETAAYGMLGLETCYSLLNQALGENAAETVVRLLAYAPREILGLDLPAIKEGMTANLTLFNQAEKWTFEKKDLGSKSSNSPWIGKELQGKVVSVYTRGQYFVN